MKKQVYLERSEVQEYVQDLYEIRSFLSGVKLITRDQADKDLINRYKEHINKTVMKLFMISK